MSRRKSIPNNVRALREEILLSKAELARKAGVSPLTVDRIENGADCRLATKRKIILALGKRLEEKAEVFPVLASSDKDAEEQVTAETATVAAARSSSKKKEG